MNNFYLKRSIKEKYFIIRAIINLITFSELTIFIDLTFSLKKSFFKAENNRLFLTLFIII